LIDELCRAFCQQLKIRPVPAGSAVSTAFEDSNGEPIGFYLVGPDNLGRYRIEDDGTTVPYIEATGADLESQTRREAVDAMLTEYGARYDEDSGELKTAPLDIQRVPQAALKFVALLLRLQDLVLLTPERAASTFKEDASKAIRASFGSRSTIRENEQIAPGIEFPADLVIEAPDRPPVAIFLAMSDQRVLEAVVAQMAAQYETDTAYSVIALLEKDTTVTQKLRRRASNRLTALPIYEGDERAAIQRIEREVFGSVRQVH
jgi:Domain of unknown function DUF1828